MANGLLKRAAHASQFSITKVIIDPSGEFTNGDRKIAKESMRERREALLTGADARSTT